MQKFGIASVMALLVWSASIVWIDVSPGYVRGFDWKNNLLAR